MKAKITITGQIHGNFTLLRNLSYDTKQNGMFNSFHLYYNSVADAKKAIREAYHSIKNELDPGNYQVISKNKDNTTLYYDASKAELYKEL